MAMSSLYRSFAPVQEEIFESVPGQTTFTVRLPALERSVNELQQA
jgi:hypothetical protein